MRASIRLKALVAAGVATLGLCPGRALASGHLVPTLFPVTDPKNYLTVWRIDESGAIAMRRTKYVAEPGSATGEAELDGVELWQHGSLLTFLATAQASRFNPLVMNDWNDILVWSLTAIPPNQIGGTSELLMAHRDRPVENLSGYAVSPTCQTAINNLGDFVGCVPTNPTTSDPPVQAVIDRHSVDVGLHGQPFAINPSRQILVSTTAQVPGPGRSRIWQDGSVTADMPFYGADMNNLGHVVGADVVGTDVLGGGQRHLFLWRDGKVEDLGAINAVYPYAINDFDQIVGSYIPVPGNGDTSAFIWDNGVLTDLNTVVVSGSTARLSVARDVNNAGQIIGFTKDGSFLLDLNTCVDADQNGTADNDGDGLCDNWEADGIDFDHDGSLDFVLADTNKDGVVDASEHADMNHKDVYVEVDWMERHKPLAGAIQAVVDAFANSPVTNPDGTTGVRLHVLVDEQAIVHQDELSVRVNSPQRAVFDSVKSTAFGTLGERESVRHTAILGAKRMVFRYALFIHDQLGSKGTSGIAELDGNDLVVSLGSYAVVGGHPRGNVDEQAGTFMHELGHTLGLKHGGIDDVNCKPNYLSVMSYTRQFDGVAVFGRKLDYSRLALPDLDETKLIEANGIKGPAGEMTAYAIPRTDPAVDPIYISSPADEPIDWNNDDAIAAAAITADVNGPCWKGPYVLEPFLVGFADWPSLAYNFRDNNNFADGVHDYAESPPTELTLEGALALSPDADSDGVTNLLDDCIAISNPAQDDADGDGVGDACDDCPTVYNPSQAPCASLPAGGEPDESGAATGTPNDAGAGGGGGSPAIGRDAGAAGAASAEAGRSDASAGGGAPRDGSGLTADADISEHRDASTIGDSGAGDHPTTMRATPPLDSGCGCSVRRTGGSPLDFILALGAAAAMRRAGRRERRQPKRADNATTKVAG